MKSIEDQLVYKKKIGFTLQQKEAFDTLASYGVNVSQFIRQAVKEKIRREWKITKQGNKKIICPFLNKKNYEKRD